MLPQLRCSPASCVSVTAFRWVSGRKRVIVASVGRGSQIPDTRVPARTDHVGRLFDAVEKLSLATAVACQLIGHGLQRSVAEPKGGSRVQHKAPVTSIAASAAPAPVGLTDFGTTWAIIVALICGWLLRWRSQSRCGPVAQHRTHPLQK